MSTNTMTEGQRGSVYSEREALLSALREATARAAQLDQGVLASFTRPVEWFDTIHVFHAALHAQLGEAFFWEQPAQRSALVGIGAVTSLETGGSSTITEAAAAWRALLRDAVVTYAPEVVPAYGSGPTLLGGFAFDPLRPQTDLWHGFPGGLLVLPRLLLSYHAGSVSLTINTLVHATDTEELLEQAVIHDVRRLFAAIATDEAAFREDTTGGDDGHDTSGAYTVADIRPAEEWMQLVGDTVEMLRQGMYEKVVLARSVEVTPHDTHARIDVSAMLQRLRASYPDAYIFAIQRGERFFVGATPERLVQAQDGHIQTMALAGSARRGASEEEDTRIGNELLQSEKNHLEHTSVVNVVRDALLQHCASVHFSDAPRLLKLKNIQHLETPISGELLPGRCILDVMTSLHPTSAVGGVPREAALELIRRTEQLDRGWYAGPVGWIGAGGHGEFAVGLRSGLIEPHKATLFAGCGIVADSHPQSEYEESCLKLEVMLRGLTYR